MKILAFSGKKQSGKDTAVASLANHLGFECPITVIRFAGELKRIVNACFSDRVGHFETEQEKKDGKLPCGKTAREVLQIIGTDWFRSLDPDCWVRAYIKKVRARVGIILTPDVRFPNEVKCIQDLGGHVIRLLRAPFPEDKHESETALDEMEWKQETHQPRPHDCIDFDTIIDNREMSIAEQNEAVWKLVKEKKWI